MEIASASVGIQFVESWYCAYCAKAARKMSKLEVELEAANQDKQARDDKQHVGRQTTSSLNLGGWRPSVPRVVRDVSSMSTEQMKAEIADMQAELETVQAEYQQEREKSFRERERNLKERRERNLKSIDGTVAHAARKATFGKCDAFTQTVTLHSRKDGRECHKWFLWLHEYERKLNEMTREQLVDETITLRQENAERRADSRVLSAMLAHIEGGATASTAATAAMATVTKQQLQTLKNKLTRIDRLPDRADPKYPYLENRRYSAGRPHSEFVAALNWQNHWNGTSEFSKIVGGVGGLRIALTFSTINPERSAGDAARPDITQWTKNQLSSLLNVSGYANDLLLANDKLRAEVARLGREIDKHMTVEEDQYRDWLQAIAQRDSSHQHVISEAKAKMQAKAKIQKLNTALATERSCHLSKKRQLSVVRGQKAKACGSTRILGGCCEVCNDGKWWDSLAKHQMQAKHGEIWEARQIESASAKKRRKTAERQERRQWARSKITEK